MLVPFLSVMKTRLTAIILLFLVSASAQARQPSDSIKLMFWNLENFFDFIDQGTGESDAEFSSGGERHWTKKRFYSKCNSFAKAVLWLGSFQGDLPDAIGVAEVENAFVLRQLINATALKKLDYAIVHYDSPDPRGIDCALLYRPSRLKLVSSKPCKVEAPDLQTRDILLAQFLTPSGDSLALLVNHHPSKYGGGETDWRRETAIGRLRFISDSLEAEGWRSRIAAGDFNDTADNDLFKRLEPSLNLSRYDASLSRGSIRFNGEWQLIDLCFVSPDLSRKTSFRAVAVPFLTTRDAAHSGDKPLRTYSGPLWLGGVSDHLPILVVFKP